MSRNSVVCVCVGGHQSESKLTEDGGTPDKRRRTVEHKVEFCKTLLEEQDTKLSSLSTFVFVSGLLHFLNWLGFFKKIF